MARTKVSTRSSYMQESEENIDKYCRLKNGLNGYCLANIFKYLNTTDLNTLGGMNIVYRQVVKDLVIAKHHVNLDDICMGGMQISQMFRRYGSKMRNIEFKNHFEDLNATEQIQRSIKQYCSADQLKTVEFGTHFTPIRINNLPIQFRNVEILKFKGVGQHLTVQLSESLRLLNLYNIDLNPNFDWMNLKNLTELHLFDVTGVNEKNFIDYLTQRPKIEVFHYDEHVFKDAALDVCDAIAMYCGNHIRDFCGDARPLKEGVKAPARHLYDFVAEFKNVETLCLTTHQICGGDLIEAMKGLAKNNTLEKLHIVYSAIDIRNNPEVNCFFQRKPNHKGLDMRQFSHLKRINISGPFTVVPKFRHGEVCDPYKIFTKYSSQILANVEKLTIASTVADLDFIQYAPKLLQLNFFSSMKTPPKAAKILSMLDSIVKKRKNINQPSGHDVIEIQFSCEQVMRLFEEVEGRGDTVVLCLGPIFF